MAKASKTKGGLVPLDLIDEPAGVIRIEISDEGIAELADSIQSIGQLQAILLRPVGDRFEIVFGHRRFLAIKVLGRTEIRAEVKELNDVEVALMRASENIIALRLSPIEEGAVYLDLLDVHKLSLDEVGKRMGISIGVVKRRMDLLKMPPCLQKAIHSKQINYGVAEELWSLGDLGKIDYYLAFAVEHGATVLVVRAWVQDEKKKMRTQQGDVGGTGSLANPMEKRPVFVPCDVCLEAMELGTETIIRACEVCTKAISKAVHGT